MNLFDAIEKIEEQINLVEKLTPLDRVSFKIDDLKPVLEAAKLLPEVVCALESEHPILAFSERLIRKSKELGL